MSNRIQHLINKPFEVQLSDVALLQDEIDKYPYFSTLRSLLLFALKESEHESYHSELKKTSVYSPSRVALYHYLQKEKQDSSVEKMEVFEEVEETKVEFIPENEIHIDENSSIKIQVQENSIPETIEIIEEETILIEPEIEIQPETKPVSTHQEMTFSQWLHVSENKPEEKPTEKDIKFQLIDEFIEKAPRISPVKKFPESNSVISKAESPVEYSDLMTETLAQIYTEQKKYDKAIRAYKILILKYPDKAEFFSDKIEEIEFLRDSK